MSKIDHVNLLKLAVNDRFALRTIAKSPLGERAQGAVENFRWAGDDRGYSNLGSRSEESEPPPAATACRAMAKRSRQALGQGLSRWMLELEYHHTSILV
jgi:hypothetical protein